MRRTRLSARALSTALSASAAAAALMLTSPALAPLAGQAPRVTPRGDPSVRDDTLYAVAVKPEAYPEESSVLLLDDGIVRYEADGRSVRTFRQVVQILTESAVERYQEHSFSYAPRHQRLTVNWIRVVTPDGKVVSSAPSQLQDADVPATMGNPVYSDGKIRRASLTGVAPGTIVDYSYTIEELKPFLPGDFQDSWGVTTGLPTLRSRYVVDVPASLDLRLEERNLNFRRQEKVAAGRRVYTWATTNVAKYKGEPFAADSNGVVMSIALSSPTTWQRISSWYAGLARDRYEITPPVAAKIHSVVANARTLDDSIRAVHRWVAQDVRYVSLALGLGGYQPRAPQTVLETGFGDCKDKATLFVAALRSMGVTAYPVLLSSDGGVDRKMPSIGQFDHAIAAVERRARETAAGSGGVAAGSSAGSSPYVFTDLTSDVTAYGAIPFSEQGEFALVVHPDGRGEEVTLPLDPIAANRSETRLVGTISDAGLFDGRMESAEWGAGESALREVFVQPLDSTKRAAFMRGLASRWFEGADGDSLVAFDGKDLAARPRISLVVRHGKATSSAGQTEILTIPLSNMSGMKEMANELERRAPRRFPIDARKILGQATGYTELRFTMPPGWQARLPKGVSESSPFGTYESEYAQTGRELRISRRLTGARNVLPPERVGDLVAWLRAIGADDAKFIVIEKKS
jgi:hypothetical protein